MEEQMITTNNAMENTRPWLRFWARNFDILLHTMIIGILWFLLHEESISSIPNLFASVIVSFIYVFIEWFYMVIFGTTPGKKILGIKVRTNDGMKLTKEVALKRALLVWFKGIGVGAGIIQMIANIKGYQNLTRDNITTWDRDLEILVTHQRIGLIRLLICPVIVIGLTSFLLWGIYS